MRAKIIVSFVFVLLCAECLFANFSAADQENLVSLTNRGTACLRKEEYARAELTIEKVLVLLEKESPEEAVIVALRTGDLFFARHRFKESFGFHSRGAKILSELPRNPGIGDRLLGLGDRYLQRKLFRSAIYFFTRAQRVSDGERQRTAIIKTATAYQGIAKQIHSIAICRNYLRSHTDPAGEVLLCLAQAQLGANQKTKALNSFIKVANITPPSAKAGEALFYAAKICLLLNNPEGAKTAINKLLTKYPGSPFFLKARTLSQAMEALERK